MNNRHCILALLFICLLVNRLSAQKNATNVGKPFVLGEIQEFESSILSEKRILNIYLPEGYNKKDTTHYPVIYLLDGSADEDFIHVVGLVQFNSFEWINQVPKSIVVGIATVDRRRDFTFPSSVPSEQKNFPTSGYSEKFANFIEQELQTFIQSNYAVNSQKTIIGQSLGGLFASEILLKKPKLFNKYIIVSPSLWWSNRSLLESKANPILLNLDQPTEVYIAVGKEGLTPSENPRIMEDDVRLFAKQLTDLSARNLKVYFDFLPKENHATSLHQAVHNAFKFLYPLQNK